MSRSRNNKPVDDLVTGGMDMRGSSLGVVVRAADVGMDLSPGRRCGRCQVKRDDRDRDILEKGLSRPSRPIGVRASIGGRRGVPGRGGRSHEGKMLVAGEVEVADGAWP